MGRPGHGAGRPPGWNASAAASRLSPERSEVKTTDCVVSLGTSTGGTAKPGRVLIAQGGKHMQLKRSGAQYYVNVLDVLYRLVAQVAGKNAIGMIMLGMGDDSARGASGHAPGWRQYCKHRMKPAV